MEITHPLQSKSALTSPNNFKAYGRKSNLKLDLKRSISPKNLQGVKIQQRRVSDKQKPVPIKMMFESDPLKLFPILNREPGIDSPEQVSTPITKSEVEIPVVNEPVNTSDPLNLNSEEIIMKIGRKRKKKRLRTSSMCVEEDDLDTSMIDMDSHISHLVSPIENRSKFLQLQDSKPGICSPLRSPKQNRKTSLRSDRSESCPDLCYQNVYFNEKRAKYKHGNFMRSLQCFDENPMDRLQTHISPDKRVQNFKEEWFKGKQCLDIGCGDGYITHWIADHFSPFTIKGVDIDSGLINIAKRMIRQNADDQKYEGEFPSSFKINYGPISRRGDIINRKSLNRISFVQENYVPQSDEEMKDVKPCYDIIILLGVTKWIQLNYGDEGLRRTFKKIFLQLRPGGRLLLEPQTYNCYKKSKNMTLETRKNFDTMMLMPTDFTKYLLSSNVGFLQSLCLAFTRKKKNSNMRPLYLLTKGGSSKRIQNC